MSGGLPDIGVRPFLLSLAHLAKLWNNFGHALVYHESATPAERGHK